MATGSADRKKHELAVQLAKLQLDVLTAQDLSVQLGDWFVQQYYLMLQDSPHGRVDWVATEGGAIESLCAYFWDYAQFNRDYARHVRWHLLARASLRPRLFITLCRQALTPMPLDASVRPYHLGMIILNPTYAKSVAALKRFRSLVDHSYETLRGYGAARIWGSTLLSNTGTINFLLKQGFVRSAMANGIVYFEKDVST